MAQDPLGAVRDAFDAVRGQSKTLLAAAAIVAGFAASPDRLGKYDAAIAELRVVHRLQQPQTAADSANADAIANLILAAQDQCFTEGDSLATAVLAPILAKLGITEEQLVDSSADKSDSLFELPDNPFQVGFSIADFHQSFGYTAWSRCVLPTFYGLDSAVEEWRTRRVRGLALVDDEWSVGIRPFPYQRDMPPLRLGLHGSDRPQFNVVAALRSLPDPVNGGTIGEQILTVAESIPAQATAHPSPMTFPRILEYRGVALFPAVRRLTVLGIRVDTLAIPDAIDYLVERRAADNETVDLLGLRISEQRALLVGPVALALVALLFWFHMRHLAVMTRRVSPDTGQLPEEIRELAWLPMLGRKLTRGIVAVIWTLLPVAATLALVARDGLELNVQRWLAVGFSLVAAVLLAVSMRMLWRLAPPIRHDQPR